MFSLKNITKDKVSTGFGAAIIIACIISVFVPSLDIDWLDATVGIITGAAFMGLDLSKLRGGGAAVWLAILPIIILWGCKTPVTLVEHTREIRYRDTLIKIKGDTVRMNIDNTDAIKAMLMAMMRRGEKPELKVRSKDKSNPESDAKGWAQLRFTLDSLGKLHTECDCKDSLYKAEIRDVFDKEFKRQLIPVERTPWWKDGIIIVLIILLALSSIKNFFK